MINLLFVCAHHHARTAVENIRDAICRVIFAAWKISFRWGEKLKIFRARNYINDFPCIYNGLKPFNNFWTSTINLRCVNLKKKRKNQNIIPSPLSVQDYYKNILNTKINDVTNHSKFNPRYNSVHLIRIVCSTVRIN